ncbi:MAG: RNA methyltransferase [Gammaproteobacteria bacterium]|nr:RNA methyltransferase [Gammaproteobacteria bacterium]
MLEKIRIVLINTSHPGNIGAAARAMKTMGLSRLVLVQPNKFPGARATARASGADDVLANAQVCNSLEEGLCDCNLVIGTSARQRSIPWPVLSPGAYAQKALALNGQTALLFGREHSGLTNEELEYCHYLVQIPVNPAFRSLNVASAVQVLAYELHCAATALQNENGAPVSDVECPVSAKAMNLFYQHLEQTMIDIGYYDPEKPKYLMRRLRRLFNRAELDESELNILRGILAAAQKKAEVRHK